MPMINMRYEEGGSTPKGKPNLVLPRESEGEVLREEDGREYVMYRNQDTGEMVPVFGSWNEAPKVRERDEQGMGRFMAIDTSFNYPVTQNKNGEFILDEAMLDADIREDGPTMPTIKKLVARCLLQRWVTFFLNSVRWGLRHQMDKPEENTENFNLTLREVLA